MNRILLIFIAFLCFASCNNNEHKADELGDSLFIALPPESEEPFMSDKDTLATASEQQMGNKNSISSSSAQNRSNNSAYDTDDSDDEIDESMYGFDPRSEGDIIDNNIIRYMENNDEVEW